MKKNILKVGFVIISWVVLHYIHDVVKPMVIADSAVSQLEDSDVAYGQFKGLQKAFDYFFILYILPLLVFIKDTKRGFK
jgi:hypothetical protein